MRTRKDQIKVLTADFANTPEPYEMMEVAELHILEAEQRGYERVRSECAADTRRLDWLGKMLKLNAPYQPAAINGKYTADEIRAAIDAAMEGGE